MGLQNPPRGGDGGGGSDLEILHAADIVDPIPILYNTPGSKQSTTPTNTAAVKALTAGVFTVDGISTAPVDFSGVPDGIGGLTPIMNLITPAIAAVSALDGYSVSLAYVNPNFYFVVRNINGNVGVLSGNLVTAMGLNNVNEVSHSAHSPSITIDPPDSGYWRELKFFGILDNGSSAINGRFSSTYINDGQNVHTFVHALSNSGAWDDSFDSNNANGLYNIGRSVVYRSVYSDFFYNKDTGEITWDNKRNTFPRNVEVYKLRSLLVLGARGA